MSLIITHETYDSFDGNDYIIGSTISSFLLPVINLRNKTVLENNESIYQKPFLDIREKRGTGFQLTHFLNTLNKSTKLISYIISKNEEEGDVIIKVGKGYIADKDDNILLILGVTDKNISEFDSQIKRYEDNFYTPPIQELPQHPHLCLLISTELIRYKKYTLFYKKLEKHYISDAYMNDIEVRFITSEKIEKLTYTNEFKLRFNTIEQLQSHLQNLVPRLMFLTDSDYSNGINPGLNYPLSERNAIYVSPAQEQQNIFPIDILEDRINSLNYQRSINLIDDTDPPF